MKILKGESAGRLKNPVISIGVFDGVHRGHAAVFSVVSKRAADAGSESAIVTFRPHPRLVLEDRKSQIKYLTTFEEKAELIAKHGIENLVVFDFTKEFSKVPPCRFVEEYLVRRTGLRHLVFGFDHHFGHRRQGNYHSLQGCAGLHNFSVEQLEPVMCEGHRVSSTMIRRMLEKGNVEGAARLLSYPYSFRGRIVGGRQVGRMIGYPTANIIPDDDHKLIPANGVYAVNVLTGGSNLPGMMNIGVKPTLGEIPGERSMEVHIIGFKGNLYDKRIGVSFMGRIRDERHFGSLELLSKQLDDDKRKALDIISSGNPEGGSPPGTSA